MNDPSDKPHPLDDVDDATMEIAPERASGTQAYKPLLRGSLYVAGISLLIVTLASATANNAPASSALQLTAQATSRIAAIILLMACLSLLVSFRLPQLIEFLQRPPQPTSVSGKKTRPLGTLAKLLLFSGALLVACWLFVLMLVVSPSNWAGYAVLYLVLPLSVIAASVLVTIALWHQGIIRAYAVGTLTALLLQALPFLWMLMSIPYRRGGPLGDWGALLYGIFPTLLILSGLACAVYVYFLEKHRAGLALLQSEESSVVSHSAEVNR